MRAIGRMRLYSALLFIAIVVTSTFSPITVNATENTEVEMDSSTAGHGELVMANTDAAINVRAEASTESESIAMMFDGVGGIKIDSVEGWTKVRFDNDVEGWVKNDYLFFGADAIAERESNNQEAAVYLAGNVSEEAVVDASTVEAVVEAAVASQAEANADAAQIQSDAEAAAKAAVDAAAAKAAADAAAAQAVIAQQAQAEIAAKQAEIAAAEMAAQETAAQPETEAAVQETAAEAVQPEGATAAETETITEAVVDATVQSQAVVEPAADGQNGTAEEVIVEETPEVETQAITDAQDASGQVAFASTLKAEPAPVEGPTIVQQATSYTVDEINLLAALIYCEAGNQSYEGKVAVGAVVMNRVENSRFSNTIQGVIYQKSQFTPAGSGKVARILARGVDTSCIQAAIEALNGSDPTSGKLYFRRNNGRNGQVIGDHVFY